ncbi:MAG: PAS domain S-box protein [Halobacteriota archaeon]
MKTTRHHLARRFIQSLPTEEMTTTYALRRDPLEAVERQVSNRFDDEPVDVVVVDDDADFLDITEIHLSREHPEFNVVPFTTVEDALKYLADGPVDAIVSDYLLPETTGLQFLEHVRNDDPELPFLLFTGQGSEELASRAIKAGVTDYLQKGTDPSQFSVLANRLHNAIQRHRARTALSTSHRRYAKLVENSSDVISVIEEDGTGKYLSPSSRHVLGYDPEELVGENAFEYIHPEDREEVLLMFSHLLEHPSRPARVDYRFKDPDGEWPILEARGKNLLDDPFVRGVVVNARDVTDNKEREAELRHQRNQLENLRKSLSHDLKSPLSVAFSTLTLHREEGDPEHITTIHRALERINHIIDQMVELSEHEGTITEMTTVKLEEVVSAAWAMVDTMGATLHVVDSKQLEADPGRLQQLFEHLFRNAITHGGQDVTISVTIDGDAILVEDDGPGIDATARDDIFEPGFSTGDGMGYGLVIVKQIALGHGWEIDVDTGADGGARFVIAGIDFEPHVYT